MTKEQLGRRIRQARKDRGLTQADLADLVGVTQTTVHAWEAGSHPPSWEKLGGLAKAFGTTVSWLTLLSEPEAA